MPCKSWSRSCQNDHCQRLNLVHLRSAVRVPAAPYRPYAMLAAQGAEFGDQQPMITKDTLRLLMRQVDKEQKLDMDVEDLLLDVANEFVRSVSDSAAKLARHRGSSSLDVRDVLFELDRTHDIRVPGYGEDLSTEGVRKGKSMLRAHASRVLHVRDTMRKEAIAKRSSTRTKRRT
ncbi:transcription initiation factor TFIID subunit A-domain-containing protein [Entophlyctis helioformis]|nr:transcription initiation factor TFIID subunit A-domain-containing protein [Entophlyctis helioformis]